MSLGISASTFTLAHVVVSFVGIGSGFVVLFGLLNRKRLEGWTMIFLTASILTSVSGFLFPFEQLLPSHVLGLFSLSVLTIAVFARYVFGFTGSGRWIYVVAASLALYFNCVAAVVQMFAKISALRAIAPTRTEPVFVTAQLVLLAAFAVLTVLAIRRFDVSRAPRRF